jgi:LAO/AO transport system kinase
MVDFFMVLMLPGGGDELQGIKRGIMELADALVINKADGDSEQLAKQTRQHYNAAMHLLRQTSFWTPRVMTCSALKNQNIDAVWGMLVDYWTDARKANAFDAKRARQNRDWMHSLLNNLLLQRLQQNPRIRALLPELEQAVEAGETTAYAAARRLIDLL